MKMGGQRQDKFSLVLVQQTLSLSFSYRDISNSY